MGHSHARPERASLRNRAPFDEIPDSRGMTRRGQNNKVDQITDEKTNGLKEFYSATKKNLIFIWKSVK